jgi:hypothetical protein
MSPSIVDIPVLVPVPVSSVLFDIPVFVDITRLC